ncbi:MAG: GAF domain-containing protein [Planctomycetes bacterium]|nr:GAF domain-containing protein [Planctomycetota bacterium]MCW8134853.1 GAF domain-containing protein [Planctomycetota bacterium]
MRPPTTRLNRRLPITSQRQSLTVVIYSSDASRRAALLAAIDHNRKFDRDADTVIEVAEPSQTGAFALRNGTVLVMDTDSPPFDQRFLDERAPSAVLASWGTRSDESWIDVHLTRTPEPAEVSRFLYRARELTWLRSRAFNEGATASSAEKLARLNRIGTALSDVRVLRDLLSVVLTEARNIMDADAGSIYIIEHGKGSAMSGRKVLGRAERRTRAVAVKRAALTQQLFSLRFAAAQNDTVQIPFEEIVFPANLESIAGYAAITGEIVAIDDVYHLPEGAPYKFNKFIDEKYGYRTCSMLTVPLKNTMDDVVGVVQLINKKRDPLKRLQLGENAVGEIIPFSEEDIELAASLGSQAGVAIENVRLMDAITHLFERFVIACVQAVEQRDPATAGHSGRVDRVTMALADEVNKDKTGAYKDFSFTDAEMVELHYASLLHDFGKIGVREHVLQKAEKLFPAQAQAIEFRAEIIRREIRLDALEREARLIEQGRRSEVAALREQCDRDLAALEDDFQFIRKHIKPIFVTDEAQARLDAIHTAPRRIGQDSFPLLSDEEYRSLCTRRGTLNAEERKEIENHVADSWKFLKQIPWTEDLARVPEIAGQHHEKMKGGGYPNGIPAGQTPLGSRLMAVADVFDSLTASDRPYKPAIPLERALQILDSMAAEGDLDPDVVNLFKDTKIWEKLKLKVVRLADANEAQKAAR